MNKLKKIFRHFLIPHKKNNYRAKALHIDALAVYLVLVMCVTLIFKQVKPPTGDILGYATDITIQKVYDLTNKEREKNSLPPLEYNETLSKAALNKAKDMFEQNYWSHYGPDGTTPWNFILTAGYQYEYAGENLAKNFMFSDGVVKAWMESPTHRDNIVRKEYTDVGYAVVNGILNGEETTLVVQMFGTPISTGNNTVFAEENQLPPVENTEVENIEKEEDISVSPDSPERIEVESGKPVIAYDTSSVQAVQNQKTDTPSFFGIAYNTQIILFMILLIIIAVDLYVAIKFHIIRVTGKNIIHVAFIIFIIAGVYLLAKGAIL